MKTIAGILDQGVRQVIRARGEQTTRFSLTVMAKTVLAIPLTQLVHAIAIVSNIFAQSVDWRGITYQIKGSWNIRLVEYHRYQPLDQAADTNASL